MITIGVGIDLPQVDLMNFRGRRINKTKDFSESLESVLSDVLVICVCKCNLAQEIRKLLSNFHFV